MELPGQIVRIDLLLVQLIDERPGAILRCSLIGLETSFSAVRLGHEVGVERAGDIGDVHHLGAHRIADLERRHRPRAADVIDLHLALAVRVHLLDEALEVLGKLGALGEGGDRAQRHLLGQDRSVGRGDQPAQSEPGNQHLTHGNPLDCSQTAGMAALFVAVSIKYNRAERWASQTPTVPHPATPRLGRAPAARILG